MALEQRYVVALRVVDCRSVFLTAIHKMTPQTVFCAKGQPVSSTIIEEGLRRLSVCERTYRPHDARKRSPPLADTTDTIHLRGFFFFFFGASPKCTREPEPCA
eukprot:5793228-Prymnesium_polylepis.1